MSIPAVTTPRARLCDIMLDIHTKKRAAVSSFVYAKAKDSATQEQSTLPVLVAQHSKNVANKAINASKKLFSDVHRKLLGAFSPVHLYRLFFTPFYLLLCIIAAVAYTVLVSVSSVALLAYRSVMVLVRLITLVMAWKNVNKLISSVKSESSITTTSLSPSAEKLASHDNNNSDDFVDCCNDVKKVIKSQTLYHTASLAGSVLALTFVVLLIAGVGMLLAGAGANPIAAGITMSIRQSILISAGVGLAFSAVWNIGVATGSYHRAKKKITSADTLISVVEKMANNKTSSLLHSEKIPSKAS